MRFAPLSGGFMITSIIGFLVSVIIVYKYSPAFGFSFATVFVLMFIASILSMTYADSDAILKLDKKEEAPAEPVKKKKKKR